MTIKKVSMNGPR